MEKDELVYLLAAVFMIIGVYFILTQYLIAGSCFSKGETIGISENQSPACVKVSTENACNNHVVIQNFCDENFVMINQVNEEVGVLGRENSWELPAGMLAIIKNSNGQKFKIFSSVTDNQSSSLNKALSFILPLLAPLGLLITICFYLFQKRKEYKFRQTKLF